MIPKTRSLLLALATLPLVALTAHAGNLPPAFFGVFFRHDFVDFTQYDGPGEYENVGAVGEALNQHSPRVVASLKSVPNSGPRDHQVNSEVQYFFRVNSPAGTPPGTLIPMDITAFLQYTWSAPVSPDIPSEIFWSVRTSVSASSFSDTGPLDSIAVDIGCVGPNPFECDPAGNTAKAMDLPVTLHLMVVDSGLNVVQLNAGITFTNTEPSIIGGPGAFSSFFAMADPVISIDPSFDSTGWSLQLSDGVSNEANAVVPEPGSFGLAGLAAAGLLFARRRARSATPGH